MIFFDVRCPASIFGVFFRQTIDFWPYIAIFKTYGAPIRPLTRALDRTQPSEAPVDLVFIAASSLLCVPCYNRRARTMHVDLCRRRTLLYDNSREDCAYSGIIYTGMGHAYSENYDTIRYGRFTCAQKLTKWPS